MAIAQRNLICGAKGIYSTADGRYNFIKRGRKWFVFDVQGVMHGRRAVPVFEDGHSSLLEAREFLRRKTGILEYQA
ncbi:MAG: hypothetical protein IJ545_06970 [Alphaproteobacteria bacterium]|nr:hypothetical protein [Alphaproteobacteria bacterium]